MGRIRTSTLKVISASGLTISIFLLGMMIYTYYFLV
jgi:hypothetical protein